MHTCRWIEEKGTSELKEAEQSEKNAISKYHTLKVIVAFIKVRAVLLIYIKILFLCLSGNAQIAYVCSCVLYNVFFILSGDQIIYEVTIEV